jgi:hypothetical protein
VRGHSIREPAGVIRAEQSVPFLKEKKIKKNERKLFLFPFLFFFWGRRRKGERRRGRKEEEKEDEKKENRQGRLFFFSFFFFMKEVIEFQRSQDQLLYMYFLQAQNYSLLLLSILFVQQDF